MKVVGSTETLGLSKTLYKYFYTILTRVTFLFLNKFLVSYRSFYSTSRLNSFVDNCFYIMNSTALQSHVSTIRDKSPCDTYAI